MTLLVQDRLTQKTSLMGNYNLDLSVDTIERACLKVSSQARLDAAVVEASFKMVNNGTLDIWYNSYNPANSYFSIEVVLLLDHQDDDWSDHQFLYQTLASRYPPSIQEE